MEFEEIEFIRMAQSPSHVWLRDLGSEVAGNLIFAVERGRLVPATADGAPMEFEVDGDRLVLTGSGVRTILRRTAEDETSGTGER